MRLKFFLNLINYTIYPPAGMSSQPSEPFFLKAQIIISILSSIILSFNCRHGTVPDFETLKNSFGFSFNMISLNSASMFDERGPI
ncbi:hypothetical protein OA416_00645 [Paracoccaceae bacterium]|nr:hypothetical protein [Paracoccaceae bacterium]